MKALTAKHFLLSVGIDQNKVPWFDAYRETEHYAVTRQFLNDPEGMLGQLLKE